MSSQEWISAIRRMLRLTGYVFLFYFVCVLFMLVMSRGRASTDPPEHHNAPFRSPRIYLASFDDFIQEYRPFPTSLAKKSAKPHPRFGPSEQKRLANAFRPAPSERPLSSIRLAAELSSGWLVADKFGAATLNGQTGRIEVLTLVSTLRAIETEDSKTHRLRIQVTNRSAKSITIQLPDGNQVGKVQGRKTTGFDLWLTSLDFCVGAKKVGSFSPSREGEEVHVPRNWSAEVELGESWRVVLEAP